MHAIFYYHTFTGTVRINSTFYTAIFCAFSLTLKRVTLNDFRKPFRLNLYTAQIGPDKLS